MDMDLTTKHRCDCVDRQKNQQSKEEANAEAINRQSFGRLRSQQSDTTTQHGGYIECAGTKARARERDREREREIEIEIERLRD